MHRNLLDFRARLAHNGCMRKKWLGVVLMVFAFAAILFYVLNRGPAEPTYKGKRISLWIEPLFNPAIGGKERQKAFREEEEAVLAVGTNAIPYYAECLQDQDSRLKAKVLGALWSFGSKHDSYSVVHFAWIHSARTHKSFAHDALRILQSDAKSVERLDKNTRLLFKLTEKDQENMDVIKLELFQLNQLNTNY